MTWTRVFIQCGVNVRHSLLKMHIKLNRICQMRYNETRNKLQYLVPTKDIPGPKGLPLIGNLFRFMPYIGEYHNVNTLTFLRMLRDKYGNIVKFNSPTKERPCIFLFCPELCKNMYQSQGKWPMRIIAEPLLYYRKSRKDIYNGEYGLVSSQGKSWQNFRSKVNPYMIRPDIVKTHVKQIYEVASEFMGKMRKLRDPKTLELPNDFINELHKWSLESKCSFVLNCKLGYLTNHTDLESQIMINCTQETTKLISRLENTLFLWKVMKMWNLKKLFRAMDTFHAISGKYIEYAETKFMKKTNKTNSEDRCVLENLLYVDRQTAHIMALETFMNIETISNAAGALLYHIASNPKRQEKLREEVMSVLLHKTTPITHDILKRIPYVKACVKESLRLFPIVNGVLRTMQTDITIGRYVISKETDVIACHAVISMDPMYFMQPEEFIPERWMRDSSEFPLYKNLHPFTYMPFGFGVRSCIGQRFVEIELEMLLLNIIRNFRIEWHHGPLEYETLITNVVKSPLRLKLIDL